jgi:HK97 family phage prohead protease
MATVAMVFGFLGMLFGGTSLAAVLWVAHKANILAEQLGPDRITADNAADVVRALAGEPVTASSSERTVTGLIVPYGTPGDTSAGSYAVEPGAFQLPADLSRVKLLRGHDRNASVGYLASTREDSAGLWGTFAVAPGPDGDEAIAAVRARTRDGLSYEVSRVQYSTDRTRVVAARLDAVALCSVPAYDDARAVAASRQENLPMLTLESARAILADANASDADRAAAIAYLSAHTDATDADRAAVAAAAGNSPADTDAPGDGGTGAPAATDAPNLAAVTAGRPPGISIHGNRRPAQLTAEQGIERLAAQLRGAVDAGQINAALADVVPADDTGQGFLRAQWIGELWTAVRADRPFIDSINRARLTSGLKVHGWKWETRPEVDAYAGNKAEIPTNPVRTVPAEEPIRRTAGGWDVDRIYFDLGDAGFLSAFLNAASQDYAVKTEAQVVADLLADSTPATADTLLSALGVIAGELSEIGASPSFIGVSPDLWEDYLSITSADAPWWLTKQSTVALSGGGSSNVADLRVFSSPSLPAGTVLGGDRRAATYYEAQPSPIRVQAVNIPQGGIDLGVFGYDALLVNDARALIKTSVTVIP